MAQAKDSKKIDLMAGDHFFVVKKDDPGVPHNYDSNFGGFIKRVPKRGIIDASIQTSSGLVNVTLKSSRVKKSYKKFTIDSGF